MITDADSGSKTRSRSCSSALEVGLGQVVAALHAARPGQPVPGAEHLHVVRPEHPGPAAAAACRNWPSARSGRPRSAVIQAIRCRTASVLRSFWPSTRSHSGSRSWNRRWASSSRPCSASVQARWSRSRRVLRCSGPRVRRRCTSSARNRRSASASWPRSPSAQASVCSASSHSSHCGSRSPARAWACRMRASPRANRPARISPWAIRFGQLQRARPHVRPGRAQVVQQGVDVRLQPAQRRPVGRPAGVQAVALQQQQQHGGGLDPVHVRGGRRPRDLGHQPLQHHPADLLPRGHLHARPGRSRRARPAPAARPAPGRRRAPTPAARRRPAAAG